MSWGFAVVQHEKKRVLGGKRARLQAEATMEEQRIPSATTHSRGPASMGFGCSAKVRFGPRGRARRPRKFIRPSMEREKGQGRRVTRSGVQSRRCRGIRRSSKQYRFEISFHRSRFQGGLPVSNRTRGIPAVDSRGGGGVEKVE